MRARATAKAILLGEHAVVHGIPAIAVPVTARATEVDVVESDAAKDISVDDERKVDTDLAARMARLALDMTPTPARGARVRIASTIPIGSGLGSSAALAVALVRACDGGQALPPDEVARRANELERLAHGTPSGVDAAAIAHERPLVFARGAPPEPLALGAPLSLAVGVLPRTGTTASLVAEVRKLQAERPDRFMTLLSAVREAVEDGRRALGEGDLERLAGAMEANQGLLRELGVSRKEIARACDAVFEAGALGAKLSGAGGGGAVIALLGPRSDPDRVLAAFRSSGATEAFLTDVPASARKPDIWSRRPA